VASCSALINHTADQPVAFPLRRTSTMDSHTESSIQRRCPQADAPQKWKGKA
jgi:hypothetical protein